MRSARIVGSGLIGTSIGLALAQRGIPVQMGDRDARAERLAQELVGPFSGGQVDLVIFATPSTALSEILNSEFARNPHAGFIDVGSIKSKVLVEVERSSIPRSRFCPTHPMAGREIGGAEAGQGDLFQSRAWIYDPMGVDHDVVAMVRELISVCGALPVEMASSAHDRAVAKVSHLAQIASSLLAAQLLSGSDEELSLAGAGLRDTTRIAGSDPELWADIISMNATEIEPLLISMMNDLQNVITHLDDRSAIKDFIQRGREGRARIPGKHGGKQREYTFVPIVIDDKPGQLRLIFDECAAVGVNVEDLSIEHSPGQEKGLVTLAMSRVDAEKFSEHMRTRGWSVHPWR